MSPDSIDRLVAAYLPGGIRDDIRRFVEEGRTVELGPGALGPYVSLRQEPYWTFELGFQWAPSRESRTIVGLDPGSAAFRAGLREGQRLRGWEKKKIPTAGGRPFHVLSTSKLIESWPHLKVGCTRIDDRLSLEPDPGLSLEPNPG